MRELKENLKKYLLIKYAERKLNQSTEHISKSIPWIQRKSLTNTIQTHFKVLITDLIHQNNSQRLRQNKFIVDSILKYTLGRSENLLKSNKNAKEIKAYMQLNSYVVYDEIMKGAVNGKNKKAVKFNIEKQLSEIQEKIKSKQSIEDILQDTINKDLVSA